MFDNIYLNSLFIILVVFLLTIIFFVVYTLILKNKDKENNNLNINVRKYTTYIKYNYRTKKYTLENYQIVDQKSMDKLNEYIKTLEFHKALLNAKNNEPHTFNYVAKYNNFEIDYQFTVKELMGNIAIVKVDVLNQEKKDTIYLKTLDDLKMEHMMANNKNAVFLYINIKNFNSLNQRYGRAYGDYILELLRTRLNNIHKYKCSCAYAGSAQYAIYINKKFSKRKAIRFANYVVKELAKPIDEKYLYLDISIGVGVCIGNYEDFNDFVKYSYVAADYAKKRNKYSVILYTDVMKSEENLVISCQREVEKIINTGRVDVEYNPVYNPKKNKYIGYISTPVFKNDFLTLSKIKQAASQIDKLDDLMITLYKKQLLYFIKRRPSKRSKLVLHARLEDLSSLIEVYFSERSFQECKIILCLDVKKGYELINKFSNISNNISRLLNAGIELATIISSSNMYDYDYILRISDYLVLDNEVISITKNNMIENKLLHMIELAKHYKLDIFALDVDEYLEFECLLKYNVEYIAGKYLGDSAEAPTQIEYTRTRLLSKIVQDSKEKDEKVKTKSKKTKKTTKKKK